MVELDPQHKIWGGGVQKMGHNHRRNILESVLSNGLENKRQRHMVGSKNGASIQGGGGGILCFKKRRSVNSKKNRGQTMGGKRSGNDGLNGVKEKELREKQGGKSTVVFREEVCGI